MSINNPYEGTQKYEAKLQKASQAYSKMCNTVYWKADAEPYENRKHCFETTHFKRSSGCPGDSGGPLYCDL